MWPPIPLFWTSGDIFSRFQSQNRQPYSCLVEVYTLPILWDSTLVQHLLTSWWTAWKPSWSLPCTCEQALVGLETRTYPADECSTDWPMPARLASSKICKVNLGKKSPVLSGFTMQTKELDYFYGTDKPSCTIKYWNWSSCWCRSQAFQEPQEISWAKWGKKKLRGL